MKKRKFRKNKAVSVVVAHQSKRSKRRQRGKRRKFTHEEKQTRYSIWDNSCAYCGVKGKQTADHFIPLATGGKVVDVLANIIPACFSCNNAKGCKEAYSWYSQQKFFSQERWKKILDNI